MAALFKLSDTLSKKPGKCLGKSPQVVNHQWGLYRQTFFLFYIRPWKGEGHGEKKEKE
jgi:hypothetical protein